MRIILTGLSRETTSRCAALAVTTGHGRGQNRRRHRAIACRAFLTAPAVQGPADRDGHVIMDTDGTHKPAVICRWVARPPCVHPHCTPTYAAWLHRVERWCAAPAR